MKAVADVILLLIAVFAYMAPSIVGYVRRVKDLGSVIVLNVFLGWSIIGWIISLAMAMRTDQTPKTGAGQIS